MTENTASFNLWDEPWVRVRRDDGKVEEVSLLEAFERASEFAGLAGELPSQDAAVLRVLLAVLYRTVRWVGDDEAHGAVRGWSSIWCAGHLPMERIEAYRDAWRHRFDLLDPEAPFMQVADLHTASGRTSGLPKLIADVPDGYQFFTVRAGSGLERVSLAEGTRWLIHCHAYDPAGIKSGAVDDPRVKGGKGYGAPLGWAGSLGLFIVEGDTLFETLLLNLDVRLASGPEAGHASDRPVWERSPLGPGVESRPGPTGPADLMTWPARRVRLIVDGEDVVDTIIGNGDRIEATDQRHQEPMTAWRRKSPRDPVYPRRHAPDRAVWRGFESTLRGDLDGGGSESIPPMLVQEWLAQLITVGALPVERHIRWRAVGLVYGTMSSVIAGAVTDRMDIPIALFERPDLIREVHSAVAVAFQAISAVGQLAWNLARAAGGEPDDPRTAAREAAYAVVDPHFRSWILGLTPETEPREAAATWQRDLYRVLLTHGVDLVEAAGPRAAQGSIVADLTGGKPGLLDSGLAEKFYRSTLLAKIPVVADDVAGQRPASQRIEEDET